MLILDRHDIEGHIDPARLQSVIADAYRAYSAGTVTMPPVGHIAFPDNDGDCHIKAGHVHGDGDFVIKVATGFARNAAKGLPSGNGVSLVLSATSGEVKAVLHDEMHLTDLRTAAGSAVATGALARPDALRVLIVGTGVQTRHQVHAHAALLGPEARFRIWGRRPEAAQQRAATLVDEMATDLSVEATDDLEAACAWADIIVTATAATAPLIQATWIRPGTHINAVGADAPGKQELSVEVVANADCCIADSRAQCVDHGELSHAVAAGHLSPEAIGEIGELLMGRCAGRRSADDITVADLTGLAVQDIAIARMVLDSAQRA